VTPLGAEEWTVLRPPSRASDGWGHRALPRESWYPGIGSGHLQNFHQLLLEEYSESGPYHHMVVWRQETLQRRPRLTQLTPLYTLSRNPRSLLLSARRDSSRHPAGKTIRVSASLRSPEIMHHGLCGFRLNRLLNSPLRVHAHLHPRDIRGIAG
jgi:hypothetical protein